MIQVNDTWVAKNGLELARISPKIHGRYSPNLYAWLRANRPQLSLARVWRNRDGCLWIGFFEGGFFCGAKLHGVLGYGTKEKVGAWIGLAPLTEVDGFWSEYVRIGRCAIDPEHEGWFLGERWSESGDKRTCLWCGATQERRVVMVEDRRWVRFSREVDA